MQWQFKCEVKIGCVWWKLILNSHLNSNSGVPGGTELGLAFEFKGLGECTGNSNLIRSQIRGRLGVISQEVKFKFECAWGKWTGYSNYIWIRGPPGGNEMGIWMRFEFKFEGAWGKWNGNVNRIRIQGCLRGNDLRITVRVLIRGRQGVRNRTRGGCVRARHG